MVLPCVGKWGEEHVLDDDGLGVVLAQRQLKHHRLNPVRGVGKHKALSEYKMVLKNRHQMNKGPSSLQPELQQGHWQPGKRVFAQVLLCCSPLLQPPDPTLVPQVAGDVQERDGNTC